MGNRSCLGWSVMAAGLFASTILSGSARAGERSVPLVVELFTSQGCSSCPPANANLVKLRDRPDVLPLSFAVTYWDRLGWKDTFGKPEFTARQETYESPLGRDGPFTPQMVVNGGRDIVGNDLAAVDRILAGERLRAKPSIRLDGRSIEIGSGAAPQGGADIWLVRYDPQVVTVAVRRGENTGRTLPHTNVVHELERIGQWTGGPTRVDVTAPARPGLRTAVLVQVPGGGPILAAATD